MQYTAMSFILASNWTTTFGRTKTKEKFDMHHKVSCKINYTIYLLEYLLCKMQYVRKLDARFYDYIYIWYLMIRTKSHQLPNNDLSFLVTWSHLITSPDCLMVRACARHVWGCEFKFYSGKLSVWNQETLAQNKYQIY